jgi:glucan phosphoethanolaminetransferase (alkaline phosphatase superfamily)
VTTKVPISICLFACVFLSMRKLFLCSRSIYYILKLKYSMARFCNFFKLSRCTIKAGFKINSYTCNIPLLYTDLSIHSQHQQQIKFALSLTTTICTDHFIFFASSVYKPILQYSCCFTVNVQLALSLVVQSYEIIIAIYINTVNINSLMEWKSKLYHAILTTFSVISAHIMWIYQSTLNSPVYGR